MIGLAIGILCGLLDLLLLYRLMSAVQKGEALKTIIYLFLKLLVIACAFVPTILFFRQDLLWCGVGISASLITGAIIFNIRSQGLRKGGKKT